MTPILPTVHQPCGTFEHECPICMDNDDDAFVDGLGALPCASCGQMYCGGCREAVASGQVVNCPTENSVTFL